MNELVSVIITTYGRTKFLESAIKSVIAQTYKNIEIIIVDDNAQRNDIRKEVMNIVSKFSCCKLILNKTNLGGSLSRNEGIFKSKGYFISFLDDDDTYEPQRIEKNVKTYKLKKNTNIGLIYTYCNTIDEKGRVIGEYRINLSKKPILQHMNNCLCATSQWFIPRYVFNNVGYFEDTPCKQDSIMLLKILGNDYDIICIPEKLSNYREHQKGRISGNPKRDLIGRTNLRNWCRKYYSKLNINEIKEVEATYAMQLVYYNAIMNNRIEALTNLVILLKNKWTIRSVVKCFVLLILGSKYLKIKRNE